MFLFNQFKRHRRNAVLILAVAIAAVSAAVVSAAPLSVTGGSLGAGSAAATSCQSTAISVSYVGTYDNVGTYRISGATLSGITASCVNKQYKATLQGAGGVRLGLEATGTFNSTTPVVLSFAPPADFDASTVTGLILFITG